MWNKAPKSTAVFLGATLSYFWISASAAQAYETFYINGNKALNTNSNFRKIDGKPRMSIYQRNDSDPDQQFDRLSGNLGGTLLKQRSTGLCLNGHYLANGGEVNTWDCNANDPDQNWNLINVSGGFLLIQRTGKNLCVDSPTRDDLGKVQLWDCNSSSPNQQWKSSSSGPSGVVNIIAQPVDSPPSGPSGTVTIIAQPVASDIFISPGLFFARNLEFRRGQQWVTSTGYKFTFQQDANLVLYNPQGRPIWATGTDSTGADLLVVQTDGNVVLYARGKPVWATNTYGKPGAYLAIQADGNIVVYSFFNKVPLFSTGTFGGRTQTFIAAREWQTSSANNGNGAKNETWYIDNIALNTNSQFRRIDNMPRMSIFQRNDNDPDQQFQRLFGNSGGILLKHRSTGSCLNAHYLSNSSEINVWSPCDSNDPDQNWNLISVSGGATLIQRKNTNFCVDSPTRSDLGRVHLITCDQNNPNQRWRSSNDPVISVISPITPPPLPPVIGSIGELYNSMKNILGLPKGREFETADNITISQEFENGRIFKNKFTNETEATISGNQNPSWHNYEAFAKRLVYGVDGGISKFRDFGYDIKQEFKDDNTGLYAVGLYNTKGQPPVLIFRGTEPTANLSPLLPADLIDDLNPKGVGVRQFEGKKGEIEKWLEKAARENNGRKPDVIGHSLGGALAQRAAVEFTYKIGKTITFNSPGIGAQDVSKFTRNGGEQNNIVVHYITEEDPVSSGGEMFLPGNVVRISGRLVKQCSPKKIVDSLSWQVLYLETLLFQSGNCLDNHLASGLLGSALTNKSKGSVAGLNQYFRRSYTEKLRQGLGAALASQQFPSLNPLLYKAITQKNTNAIIIQQIVIGIKNYQDLNGGGGFNSGGGRW